MVTIPMLGNQGLRRLGIRMLLKTQPDLCVVGEAINGSEAVSLTAL